MRNAKQEFINFIHKIPNIGIKCAHIVQDSRDYDLPCCDYVLKENHTDEEFNAFLDALNFEYEAGYGSQILYGTIWFNDGTWAERSEYDGLEWWSYRVCPAIDEVCK